MHFLTWSWSFYKCCCEEFGRPYRFKGAKIRLGKTLTKKRKCAEQSILKKNNSNEMDKTLCQQTDKIVKHIALLHLTT